MTESDVCVAVAVRPGSPMSERISPIAQQPKDGILSSQLNCHLIVVYSGADGLLSAYERAYRETDRALVAYLHDDVEIYEDGWLSRVASEFEDDAVGLVGFGGAKRHGSPDLYKVPYKLTDLARADYWSATRDAEVHGQRLAGSMEVVVLDGFALIVRRELLDKMGGWKPDVWPPHHCYDYRVCAEARRHGYKIRAVGVDCQHLGGRTATTPEYQEWAKTTKWGGDVEMHAAGHRMFYDEYRDVMPAVCE